MESVTGYLWFNTKQHSEFINITDKVEDLVWRSGIRMEERYQAIDQRRRKLFKSQCVC